MHAQHYETPMHKTDAQNCISPTILELPQDVHLLLLLLFRVLAKRPPAANALFSVRCREIGKSAPLVERVFSDRPSQLASSSALRFLAKTSSSFFFASNPSLARFIFTALFTSNASEAKVSWPQALHSLSSPDFLLDKRGLGGLTKLNLKGWDDVP